MCYLIVLNWAQFHKKIIWLNLEVWPWFVWCAQRAKLNMPISHGKDVNHDLFQGFTIASTRRDVI